MLKNGVRCEKWAQWGGKKWRLSSARFGGKTARSWHRIAKTWHLTMPLPRPDCYKVLCYKEKMPKAGVCSWCANLAPVKRPQGWPSAHAYFAAWRDWTLCQESQMGSANSAGFLPKSPEWSCNWYTNGTFRGDSRSGSGSVLSAQYPEVPIADTNLCLAPDAPELGTFPSLSPWLVVARCLPDSDAPLSRHGRLTTRSIRHNDGRSSRDGRGTTGRAVWSSIRRTICTPACPLSRRGAAGSVEAQLRRPPLNPPGEWVNVLIIAGERSYHAAFKKYRKSRKYQSVKPGCGNCHNCPLRRQLDQEWARSLFLMARYSRNAASSGSIPREAR